MHGAIFISRNVTLWLLSNAPPSWKFWKNTQWKITFYLLSSNCNLLDTTQVQLITGNSFIWMRMSREKKMKEYIYYIVWNSGCSPAFIISLKSFAQVFNEFYRWRYFSSLVSWESIIIPSGTGTHRKTFFWSERLQKTMFTDYHPSTEKLGLKEYKLVVFAKGENCGGTSRSCRSIYFKIYCR